MKPSRLAKWVLWVMLTPIAIMLVLELFFRLAEFGWSAIYKRWIDDDRYTYIYVLGESTSEGVQYQDKISPAILVSYAFNDTIEGRPTRIINLAYSGTNASYTYYQYYFSLLFKPHRHALVLIYSGINEGIENHEDPGFENWKALQHSIVLSKMAFNWNWTGNSPARYEFRYRQIVQLAKRHEHKIILSQLVGNCRDFDPGLSSGSTLLNGEAFKKLEGAKKFFNQGCYAEADSAFKLLLTQHPADETYLLFHIAQCCLKMEQPEKAAAILNSLQDKNNYLGYTPWKNRIIEKVSNEEKVPMIFLFDRFRDSSGYGLVGYRLINDAHHPNLEGYCIMANELSQQVSNLYNEPIHFVLSPENVAAHFGFDNEFYGGTYFKMIEWFIYASLQTEDRSLRLERIHFYMKKYAGYKGEDSNLMLWRLVVTVLENDRNAFFTELHTVKSSGKSEEILDRFYSAFESEPFHSTIKTIITGWKWDNEQQKAEASEFLKEMD